jgi:hypothetical protein
MGIAVITEVTDHPQPESQREARTHLFAMATIYTDTGSVPVKVRNLSSSGARVEGAVLPQVGAPVRLRRGRLEVCGEIVWCEAGAAGLRFESAVTVADWLPRGRSIAPQLRIDDVVHQARVHPSAASPSAAVDVPPSKPTAIDLMRMKHAIDSLADDLANDPAVLERHGSKLQVLDAAAQLFAKLAIRT